MSSKPRSVAVVASSQTPLSPAQRKFNQLVRQIEKLRTELKDWDAAETSFVHNWALQVQPLQIELADCRYGVVLRLRQMMGEPGWTRTERQTQREMLCMLAAHLIDDEHTDEARAAELKKWHDVHAEVAFDTAAANDMAEMKRLFETMTGVDLGDDPVASEDELMQRAFSKMQAQVEQGPPPADAAHSRKRPTAAQRRREQEEKDATQSLREVFRKLASALHPDRADDDADRQRRTEAMQRVNQAYERQDLLALLTLQLEIEQIDAAHLSSAGADKLRHYNRVLADQVSELKAERLGREAALRMRYRLDPFAGLTPRKLTQLTVLEAQELRLMLSEARLDLEGLSNTPYAKRWLRARREEMKSQANDGHDFPFDLPF